jgi:uncharacterized protein (TIGR00266 family)
LTKKEYRFNQYTNFCEVYIMPTTASGIDYEIIHNPVFSVVELYLKVGQGIKAESGAMIYMSPSLRLVTKKAARGLFKTIKRSLSGESFFANTFIAENEPGMIGLAPVYSGDIRYIPIEPGKMWLVSGGAYVASTEGLDTTSRFQGMKGFFSGENIFFLEAKSETGNVEDMFVASYGAIREFDLKPGETITVDTGNLVAVEGTCQYSVRKVGGMKSLFLSGEGLVLDVTGPGKCLAQTRAPYGFVEWISRMLPSQSGG